MSLLRCGLRLALRLLGCKSARAILGCPLRLNSADAAGADLVPASRRGVNSPMTEKRAALLLRRLRVRLVTSAGVAAALLFGLWLKVEDARAPKDPPLIVPGQSVDLGRVELTPLSLILAPPAQDGQPARLLMQVRLLNLTGESQTAVFGFPPHPPELTINDVALPEPEVILDRDDAPLTQLHPRLAEQVTLIWQVPPDWQPGPLALMFHRQTFKLKDNLYGQSSWLQFQPAARMALTLEDSS